MMEKNGDWIHGKKQRTASTKWKKKKYNIWIYTYVKKTEQNAVFRSSRHSVIIEFIDLYKASQDDYFQLGEDVG